MEKSPDDFKVDRWPELKELHNELVDLVFENQPLAGPGLTRNDSPRGRSLSVTAGGGGAEVIHTPWEITVAESPAGSGQYYASVRPGTVNSLVASNIFSAFLVVSGYNFIKIRCDTDGKTVNSVILSSDGSAPAGQVAAENTTPGTFYDLIGVVVQTTTSSSGTPQTTNTIYQVRSTNLTATPVIDFMVSRSAPSALDEPFVRWFKWSIA